MALCTWFCLHTVGPVRQIQMYDAIHVVTPLPNLIQQAKAGVLLLLLSCIWMPIHLRRAGMT